jgi:hypothetical protein
MKLQIEIGKKVYHEKYGIGIIWNIIPSKDTTYVVRYKKENNDLVSNSNVDTEKVLAFYPLKTIATLKANYKLYKQMKKELKEC